MFSPEQGRLRLSQAHERMACIDLTHLSMLQSHVSPLPQCNKQAATHAARVYRPACAPTRRISENMILTRAQSL